VPIHIRVFQPSLLFTTYLGSSISQGPATGRAWWTMNTGTRQSRCVARILLQCQPQINLNLKYPIMSGGLMITDHRQTVGSWPHSRCLDSVDERVKTCRWRHRDDNPNFRSNLKCSKSWGSQFLWGSFLRFIILYDRFATFCTLLTSVRIPEPKIAFFWEGHVQAMPE